MNMTNLITVTKGASSFFVGYLISIISYYVAPTMLELYTNTTHEGIMWFGLILVWIIGMIVVPAGWIVQGLREDKEEERSLFGVASGVVYFVIAILLTVLGWFMISALNSMITENLFKAIFWVGLLTTWALTVIVAPATKIINSSKTN